MGHWTDGSSNQSLLYCCDVTSVMVWSCSHSPCPSQDATQFAANSNSLSGPNLARVTRLLYAAAALQAAEC